MQAFLRGRDCPAAAKPACVQVGPSIWCMQHCTALHRSSSACRTSGVPLDSTLTSEDLPTLGAPTWGQAKAHVAGQGTRGRAGQVGNNTHGVGGGQIRGGGGAAMRRAAHLGPPLPKPWAAHSVVGSSSQLRLQAGYAAIHLASYPPPSCTHHPLNPTPHPTSASVGSRVSREGSDRSRCAMSFKASTCLAKTTQPRGGGGEAQGTTDMVGRAARGGKALQAGGEHCTEYTASCAPRAARPRILLCLYRRKARRPLVPLASPPCRRTPTAPTSPPPGTPPQCPPRPPRPAPRPQSCWGRCPRGQRSSCRPPEHAKDMMVVMMVREQEQTSCCSSGILVVGGCGRDHGGGGWQSARPSLAGATEQGQAGEP